MNRSNSPSLQSLQHRTLKITETADHYLITKGKTRTTPALRLRGQWLHAAGFVAGARVVVTVESGRLIIETEK